MRTAAHNARHIVGAQETVAKIIVTFIQSTIYEAFNQFIKHLLSAKQRGEIKQSACPSKSVI